MLEKEIRILKQSIIEAGRAIVALPKNSEFTSRIEKDYNNILTSADLLANQILKERLTTSFPSYGWLSEETEDNTERLQAQRVWVVDPIDGTKEYIKQIPEYAISVALVENSLPILASIYNPATQELFFAQRGKGSWLNQLAIKAKATDTHNKCTILVSRNELLKKEWENFQAEHYILQPVGSIAYKLALVAAGRATATLSFNPRNEWDIAAGILIAQEAGAIAHDIEGKSFKFNQKNVKQNGIFACSKDYYDLTLKLTNRH